MAQVEHYKGKLGFEHRSEEKLTLALTELLDALEEFGHPALQINARDPHRIGVDSDHYKIALRLRRMPLRLGVRAPKGLPAPAAYIELTLTPNFAKSCDQEISEILLAMVLRRLTEALNPLVIFWQDAPKAMTSREFLGAFGGSLAQSPVPEPFEVSDVSSCYVLEPADTSISGELVSEKAGGNHLPSGQRVLDEQVTLGSVTIDCGETVDATSEQAYKRMKLSALEEPDIAPRASVALRQNIKIETVSKTKMSAGERRLWLADQARAEAEAERARGQAVFGSVDIATPVLEQHCDEILEGANSLWIERQGLAAKTARLPGKTDRRTGYRTGRDTGVNTAVTRGIAAILSVPRTMVAATVNALRGIDLAVSLRALVTAVVVLFLHGSGMVQAAARVFLP